MLEELKQKVYRANMGLLRRGLITYTWGNVSGIDREKRLFVIKSNGVDHDVLKLSDMVVIDLEGNKMEGEMNPSSDTATHVELYNGFKEIGGIVHTYSPHATAWAQTGRALPCYGTTHADYFYGEVPCARNLVAEETEEGYEKNTGKVTIETFQGKNPVYIPAVSYKNHDLSTWGRDVTEAAHNAIMLEEIARMNFTIELINSQAGPAIQCMQDKHFMRKHESNAHYGQGK